MILTEKQLATQEVIIKKLYPGVSIEKAKEEIVGNSKPIRVWFEERIDGFCVERYGKHCEKFSTYTDGEIYGIIGPVQIPYSTIVCFETYRDKDRNGALSVNSNGVLKYGRVTRNKFIPVN